MFKKLRYKIVIRNALKGCDYERVRDRMRQQLGEMLIPRELANLLDDYMRNPCFDTAFNIIDWEQRNHTPGSGLPYLAVFGSSTFKKGTDF